MDRGVRGRGGESETARAWRAGRRVGWGGVGLMLSLWGRGGRSAQASGGPPKGLTLDQSGFRVWGTCPVEPQGGRGAERVKTRGPGTECPPRARVGRGLLSPDTPSPAPSQPQTGERPRSWVHGAAAGPPPQGPGSPHSSSSACKAEAMVSRCPREWSLCVLTVRGACRRWVSGPAQWGSDQTETARLSSGQRGGAEGVGSQGRGPRLRP